LAVFSEMDSVTKGECTGQPCNIRGTCKGKLKITITSKDKDCCSGIFGGFSPSWGSGWLAPGSDADHTFDEIQVKCAEFATTNWTLKWRNTNLQETTQAIVSTIGCSNCNAE
jgi:hypothetical protein